MTEIDKLIEEEARVYVSEESENNGFYNFHGCESVERAFVAGASFILHQNRWRKVEEELPEYKDNDYQVLGLLKNGEYETIWVIKDSIPQIEVFAYHGVTEWKPIT